ncbi:MAG: S46 family peptidase [Nannocystis sp.]|nr:S46 family peptidase [Nannocystis sp.]
MSRQKRPLLRSSALSLVTLLSAIEARADEGQWMPEQIERLDLAALRAAGLRLSAAELWDGQGGGLLRAAVNLRGCSASFISEKGLIATNHHCAYDALQARSEVGRDLLQDGFLARSAADEEEAPAKSVRVVEAITDVTAAVLAAASKATDDRGRYRAVSEITRELAKACDEGGAGRRCEVVSFFGGGQYRLFQYLELSDVRLVYAPPSSIGEFGGEVDNWMWPRHTGDFALLRAYVGPDGSPRAFHPDNVPYQPQAWLKVAAEGAGPGDFVAVLGYPGSTTRYLSSDGLSRLVDQTWPQRIDLYGEWISILEAAGARDPGLAIKGAATKKSLANRYKNAQGMLDGVARMGLLARRRAEDERLAASAGAAGREAWAATLAELAALEAGSTRRARSGFLLNSASGGPTLLAAAVELVRWSRERQRPESERVNGYLDRDEGKIWERIARRLRDHDAGMEAQILAAVLVRAAALPAEEAAAGLEALIAGKTRGDRVALEQASLRLLRGTKLASKAAMEALFKENDPGVIAGHRDPLIVAARALVDALEEAEAVSEANAGRRLVVEPQYIEMLATARPGPLYPDANGTLRISVASVRGYSPRDGLQALPQTTLAGQLAKVTGATPFALPPRVLAAAPGAASSPWADPALGDLPLCLLSDADTTGGNSGSAVINGKGELIGLNFDRVWENIAGDVAYNPARSRNVIVDVRYLLWLLDQVEDAGGLLEELGVAGLRGGAPPGRGGEAAAADEGGAVTVVAPLKEPSTTPPAAKGCDCSSGQAPAGGWLLALLLALLRRRRARG